jgi:type IV secretion system protein VirB11
MSAKPPKTGERFEGQIPQLVAAATFAIRKPVIAVFALDDYVVFNIMHRFSAEPIGAP